MATAETTETQAAPVKTTCGPCTFYVVGAFGASKTECKSLSFWIAPRAQHSRAVYYQFVEKGKRKLQTFVQTYKPSLVVLDGLGHPDPADNMQSLGESHYDCGSATLSKTRYGSFDPRWAQEFNAQLMDYLDQNQAVKVLADFRGAPCDTGF
jgi:hypothetical protein